MQLVNFDLSKKKMFGRVDYNEWLDFIDDRFPKFAKSYDCLSKLRVSVFTIPSSAPTTFENVKVDSVSKYLDRIIHRESFRRVISTTPITIDVKCMPVDERYYGMIASSELNPRSPKYFVFYGTGTNLSLDYLKEDGMFRRLNIMSTQQPKDRLERVRYR